MKVTDAPESLYIAGPMTGIPEYNYPAFFEAEARLAEAGYHVINPARIPGCQETWKWDQWMRESIKHLIRADGLALLPRWSKSRGAVVECQLAVGLDMPIRYAEDWIANAERDVA